MNQINTPQQVNVSVDDATQIITTTVDQFLERSVVQPIQIIDTIRDPTMGLLFFCIRGLFYS